MLRTQRAAGAGRRSQEGDVKLFARAGAVTDITPDQLRGYMAEHDEQEYQLVDVRQPEEYQQGHIPGALLIPVGDFEARRTEVEKLADRKAIFYCRSGVRSLRAATWASQVSELPEVFHLLGGFNTWGGMSLPDFPRLKALDLTGDVESLLRQAFDLEKGTYRLYELLAEKYAGPVAGAVSRLARAELIHGQVVHRLLVEAAEGGVPDFETLFEQTPGQLVESGESYDELVRRAQALEGQGALAILEFAADIELNAYDLYKSLAGSAAGEETRAVLVDLSQQEKHHAEGVLAALGRLAALD
jgi:rhodanese-related sulfurtransferase/rubrerythrin